MRENRAKARIVHARARFFLAHCLAMLDTDEEELEGVAKRLQRDAKRRTCPSSSRTSSSTRCARRPP